MCMKAVVEHNTAGLHQSEVCHWSNKQTGNNTKPGLGAEIAAINDIEMSTTQQPLSLCLHHTQQAWTFLQMSNVTSHSCGSQKTQKAREGEAKETGERRGKKNDEWLQDYVVTSPLGSGAHSC